MERALEVISFTILVGSVFMYLKRTDKPTLHIENTPDTENEVDVTRWKHNGTQPISTKEGNQSHILDKQSNQLLRRL